MINPEKTLEKVLIKFDEFLDYTSDSLIDNKDYNTIHKIYDKYDKLNKPQANERKKCQ
jgi:hypothetical protein